MRFPRRSEGNIAMLDVDIRTVQATVDKRKRRFTTQLQAAGYLDNSSD